ncbi:MAG: C1 family peptidase [Muribaculaceae bacterium]|nr:C1 family peptidase [Muribaculaceae bacterium]
MKYLAAALVAALSCPAFAQAPADSTAAPADTAFIFTDVISIPVTSVKDQNKSGTCWCFAGTSHLEDEILKNGGDSLDLSEMFTVRHCYADKAERYIRLYGQTNFTPGGSIMDVPYVWERYGAVPEEVYTGLQYGEDKHVHGELDAALSAYVKAVAAKPNKKISTAWRKGLNAILDAYLGEVPETFTYKGKTYTPKSYAESLGLKMDDYVPLTSFTHHPFYTSFAVEVPDNWLWEKSFNVPLDELEAAVDNALKEGYTVVWAADVSEGGFKWTDGVALMPKGKTEGDMNDTELSRWVKLSDRERQNDKYNFKAPVEEIEVSQELRQDMFDSQETTDDHGMVIVGTALDQKGNKYYKVKNSWDTNQIYDGYFYASMPYFRAKTMNILVNRKGLPKELAKKIK